MSTKYILCISYDFIYNNTIINDKQHITPCVINFKHKLIN